MSYTILRTQGIGFLQKDGNDCLCPFSGMLMVPNASGASMSPFRHPCTSNCTMFEFESDTVTLHCGAKREILNVFVKEEKQSAIIKL